MFGSSTEEVALRDDLGGFLQVEWADSCAISIRQPTPARSTAGMRARPGSQPGGASAGPLTLASVHLSLDADS